MWEGGGGHSIDLQCRTGWTQGDGIDAGEMFPVFPGKGLVFFRPLCKRLTATTVGLDGSFKGVEENVRVVQSMAPRTMSVQIKAQLLPPVPPAETMTDRTQTLRIFDRRVHDGRKPAPMPFFSYGPRKGPSFCVAFVEA